MTDTPHVVVVGSGVAGLSAAVTAAEELGSAGSVVLVERCPATEAGGNTRWTSAYLRLEDVYETADSFVEDVVGFSGGRTRRTYVEALAAAVPDTMDWIQSHGARFKKLPTYFVNSNRPRLQPVGGGEALRRVLLESAERLGVDVRYETTAVDLVRDDAGAVTGLVVETGGERAVVETGAVVIASGGFEGSPADLADALGPEAERLVPIAPGVHANKGEGIALALRAGAARSGEWDSFHAEPVDPRSNDPEALVMVFPYGILVNAAGRRFVDEGAGTVDETYEQTARTIWREDGGTAYFVTDQQLTDIPDHTRGILTSVPPAKADTVEELATGLGVPPDALRATVEEFNAVVGDGDYDWVRKDGKRTNGLSPDKTNWALPIARPPYVGYPITCAVVFTFGGLDTDERGRVLDEQQRPMPGLYAAGECTGIYYGKYPGATSVLRGMVFGRVCGKVAAGAEAGAAR